MRFSTCRPQKSLDILKTNSAGLIRSANYKSTKFVKIGGKMAPPPGSEMSRFCEFCYLNFSFSFLSVFSSSLHVALKVRLAHSMAQTYSAFQRCGGFKFTFRGLRPKNP